MKIGFIGCVKSSFITLEALLSLKKSNIEVVAVITKKNSQFNADHVDLNQICRANGIPCYSDDSNNPAKSISFMKSHKPDILYCIGWSYLLNDEFLSITEQGAIGFHPTKLPCNRGRHPIIWTLALGLKSTASSFFKMVKEADAGPIISQVDVAVSIEDDANDLYEKILLTAKQQVKDFTLALANNTHRFIEQDHSKATVWRKRTQNDGLIDWRMNASDLYNLVRALTKPYHGAEFNYLNKKIKVWKSNIHDGVLSERVEPGTVIAIENNRLLIKSGTNTAIWLLDIKMERYPGLGEYL